MVFSQVGIVFLQEAEHKHELGVTEIVCLL